MENDNFVKTSIEKLDGTVISEEVVLPKDIVKTLIIKFIEEHKMSKTKELEGTTKVGYTTCYMVNGVNDDIHVFIQPDCGR